MNDLIDLYVDTYLSEELQEEVHRSFNLFTFYEHNTAYEGLIDILNDASNQTTDTTQDLFMKELHRQLDFMLQEHTIVMTEETSLYQKNEILLALAHIQELEDYTPIIVTLESSMEYDEQLSVILEDMTMLDQATILSIVEDFSPKFLSLLKEFIYIKEENVPQVNRSAKPIVDRYRHFTAALGETGLGVNMIDNGMLLGQRFVDYLTFVEKDMITDNDEQTAMNILSVIYLSSDGVNSPFLVYRKYSYRLLQDLNRVSKIEVLILGMIAKLTEYKKALDEQARLSQTSGQA